MFTVFFGTVVGSNPERIAEVITIFAIGLFSLIIFIYPLHKCCGNNLAKGYWTFYGSVTLFFAAYFLFVAFKGSSLFPEYTFTEYLYELYGWEIYDQPNRYIDFCDNQNMNLSLEILPSSNIQN